MQRIVLPGTDLEVSRVGFGTASLHHALRSGGRQKMLAAALDSGVTHFDTARMYGEGMAERELGGFLKGHRQAVTLATKVGLPAIGAFERYPTLLYIHRALGPLGRRLLPGLWDRRRRRFSPDGAEASLKNSLKSLRTDWVDILFLHEPRVSDADAVQRLAEWLERQKASGRARYLGLAGSARECVALTLKTRGLFDVLQVEDSMAGCEADVVTAAGLPLQITFGYVRQAARSPHLDGAGLIRAALKRNRHGMVLVSSRRPDRVRAFAAMSA